MSRRCSSAQALDAWIIIRDALANPTFCIAEEDSESVTRFKLDQQNKLREAVGIMASFIANPERVPIDEPKLTTTTANIFKHVEGWTIEYPKILELAEQAEEVFWMGKEIHVEGDINNFLSVASHAQRHAMETISKVFVAQELSVANYWIDRIYREFQRPEIRAMATYFGMTEAAIHARFYSKLPEALGLDANPDFYGSYLKVKEFKERMKIIGEAVKSDDILLSIATFAIIEKVTLFTQFAVIKSFNVTPYNLFPKVADGINFSAIDENYHGVGGLMLFDIIKHEQGISTKTEQRILEIAKALLDHEYALLDMIYAEGEIDTIKKEHLIMFLHHRWNDVMMSLGFPESIHKDIGNNPVADWFYKGINNKMVSADNFAALSNTYNKKWMASNFTWGEPTA